MTVVVMIPKSPAVSLIALFAHYILAGNTHLIVLQVISSRSLQRRVYGVINDCKALICHTLSDTCVYKKGIVSTLSVDRV